MTVRNREICRSLGNVLATGVFGTLKTNRPFNDDMLAFYSGVYGREAEIKDMPEPTRHLTFECAMDNGYKIVFTGCEVNKLSEVPDGMHGLEISPNTFRAFREDVQRGPVIEASIEWQWKHNFLAFGDSFVAGDFTLKNPMFHRPMENVSEGPFYFEFAENTYGNYGSSDFQEDEILLAEPDPSWISQFDELEQWLHDILPQDLIQRIEHYGSTSISGIPAKPVIDMLVEVPSFDVVRKEIVPRLCSEDCSYSFFMNHSVFTKRTCFEGSRIAHIHMAPKNHDVWQGIEFRDCLRANPDLAEEYAELKRNLASAYQNDRNHYTMGKETFVQKVAPIMKRNRENLKEKMDEGALRDEHWQPGIAQQKNGALLTLRAAPHCRRD